MGERYIGSYNLGQMSVKHVDNYATLKQIAAANATVNNGIWT
jgi:hypothetical protein